MIYLILHNFILKAIMLLIWKVYVKYNNNDKQKQNLTLLETSIN